MTTQVTTQHQDRDEMHAHDPMAPFAAQAGVAIVAGLAGLAIGGPVIAAFGAVLGAAVAAGYVRWSRKNVRPAEASSAPSA